MRGEIVWVNEELGEVSNDPPNLDELRENVKRVRKKDQMMQRRGEEAKNNARNKLIFKNLPAGEVQVEPETETMPAPNKKSPAAAKGRKPEADLIQQAKNIEKTASPKPNAQSSSSKRGASATMNEVFAQTTDPKVKKGLLRDSIGSMEYDKDGNDFLGGEDDTYKYTKSTLKKRPEELAFSPQHDIGYHEYSNPNHRPILEMDQGEDNIDEILNEHFVTPSSKKEPPKASKQSKNEQYQLVDSIVLEKMIVEINNLQNNISSMQKENADMKRMNIEMLNANKKIRAETDKQLKSAKQDINEALKVKVEEIDEKLKEKIDQKSKDEEGTNLNLLKDVQDVKKLLEQNLLKAPLAESQFPFQQSFGPAPPSQTFYPDRQSRLAPSTGINPSGMVQSQIQFPSSVLNPQMAQQQLQASNVPTQSVNNSQSSSASLLSKWLTIVLAQKNLLASIKQKLLSSRASINNQSESIAAFQREIAGELAALNLPPTHSLVNKIRINMDKQSKQINKQLEKHQSEKIKYKERKKGLALLEKSLSYAQSLGPLGKEADRNLEDMFSAFKGIEHFKERTQDDSRDTLESHDTSKADDDSISVPLEMPTIAGVNVPPQAPSAPVEPPKMPSPEETPQPPFQANPPETAAKPTSIYFPTTPVQRSGLSYYSADQGESATLRRYFESQGKWYADLRNEVKSLLANHPRQSTIY